MGLLSFVSKGISNVGATFSAIGQNIAATVTGKSAPFTFTSPIPGAAKIAEHPFATAAVLATALNPKGAITAVKVVGAKVGGAAKNLFESLSPLQKLGVGLAAPVVIGAVSKSKKLQGDILKAPTSLTNFGANVGNLIDNPSLSNLTKTFKENPAVSSVVGLAGVAAVSGLALGAASVITNIQNTRSVKANTSATLQSTLDSTPTLAAITQPFTPSLPVQAAPVAVSTTPSSVPATVAKPKAKKKSKKKAKKKSKKKAKKKSKKKAKKKSKKKAKSIKRKKKKRSGR
jgi:cell division septation protein DedD